MRVGVLIATRGAVLRSARRPPVEEAWAMARLADRARVDQVSRFAGTDQPAQMERFTAETLWKLA